MQIHEARQDDVLIVTVQGQLDTVSAPQFEARLLSLLEAGEHRVCIDCGPLEYLNSAGLKAFLLAAKELEARGGKLVLCDLAPSVKMIFEMIGFSQIMNVVDTREEALRRLTAQAAAT
jgi:anti-anti-sigma factor